MKTKETATDTRYFISSLPVDPKRALSAIRAHWGVEAMHWILDIRRASREVLQRPAANDQRSVKQGRNHLFHWLLTAGCWLLKHFGRRPPNKSVFGGISVKRKEITWDDNKLAQIMLVA